MKPSVRKIVNVLVAALLLAYAVVAIQYCTRREAEVQCTGIEVQVLDSAELSFVTAEQVRRRLADSLVRLTGIPVREVDTYRIERLVGSMDYVSQAQAYAAMDGRVYVTLSQRSPRMRVVSEQGHNFYVDSVLGVLPPVAHGSVRVPVVSGQVPLSFGPEDYGDLDEKKFSPDRELLHNLLNFVHQVDNDPFLRALIVQIYFAPPTVDGASAGDVLLLPRLGNQVIRFGEIGPSVQAMAARLAKLSKFYRESFSEGWWQEAGEVDLKYHGQVVYRAKPRRGGVRATSGPVMRPSGVGSGVNRPVPEETAGFAAEESGSVPLPGPE